MKYFLATYFNIKGLPAEELVHFIIKAENIEKAKEFTDSSSYFLDIIRKAFPDIDNKCVNAMICELPPDVDIYELHKYGDGMDAILLNGEHMHLSTYQDLKR